MCPPKGVGVLGASSTSLVTQGKRLDERIDGCAGRVDHGGPSPREVAMLRLAPFVTVLALASAVPAQAPADATVDQVLAAWKDTRKRSLDGKPDPAAVRAVGDLDIGKLTPAQLERLCAVMLPQTADAGLKGRCRARLQEIAAAKDADGAVAAARL